MLSKGHFLPGSPPPHTYQPRPCLTTPPNPAAKGGVGAEVTASGLYMAGSERAEAGWSPSPSHSPVSRTSGGPAAGRALGSVLPRLSAASRPAERLPPRHPALAVGHVQPGPHPLLHSAVPGLHGVSPCGRPPALPGQGRALASKRPGRPQGGGRQPDRDGGPGGSSEPTFQTRAAQVQLLQGPGRGVGRGTGSRPGGDPGLKA